MLFTPFSFTTQQSQVVIAGREMKNEQSVKYFCSVAVLTVAFIVVDVDDVVRCYVAFVRQESKRTTSKQATRKNLRKYKRINFKSCLFACVTLT